MAKLSRATPSASDHATSGEPRTLTAGLAPDPSTENIWARHRFVLLLCGAVAIAVVLTGVSMVLYATSGAAQLDLSRPGYRSVSSQVDKKTVIDSFSASGSVTKDTITQFSDQYKAQAQKTTSVDAFNGDPLNPEVLEFGAPNDQ